MIARPRNTRGSLRVTHGRRSEFRITQEASNTVAPLVGERLDKVGRTTGRSQGRVLFTCVDLSVAAPSNITQLCQDIVLATVAGGDSGSPVFKVTNCPNRDDVTLYGILWGALSVSGQTAFAYSPIGNGNVQRRSEMGRLTEICASGFSC